MSVVHLDVCKYMCMCARVCVITEKSIVLCAGVFLLSLAVVCMGTAVTIPVYVCVCVFFAGMWEVGS